jgi:TIR domain
MSPRYHVFLSHSSADKPAVETLARKLLEAGIEPFFDKWALVPGRLWQPELEKGLRNSRACIIFIGSEGIGPGIGRRCWSPSIEPPKTPTFPSSPFCQ